MSDIGEAKLLSSDERDDNINASQIRMTQSTEVKEEEQLLKEFYGQNQNQTAPE